MSTSRDYRVPTGEVIKYIIFNDVSEKRMYEGDLVPQTYKMYVSRKRLQLTKCDDPKDEGILYIKFVDMNDKSDMILFSKNGKLKMEKI